MTVDETMLASEGHKSASVAANSTTQLRRRVRRPARPLARPQDFPARYGQTFVELMDVSPTTLFAFWEVDEIDLARIQRQIPTATWMVVRVYDVTYIAFDGGNAHGYFDIDVHGLINNWYIYPGMDGRSFVADIGMRDDRGRFHVLARSSSVQTPRAGMAWDGAEKWMQVDGDPRRSRTIGEEYVLPMASEEAQAALPVKGLVGLEPDHLMQTIARESIVGFYAALFRNCAAPLPKQG